MFYYAVKIECKETRERWYFGRWYSTEKRYKCGILEVPKYIIKKINTIISGTLYTYETQVYIINKERFESVYNENYAAIRKDIDNLNLIWIAQYITKNGETINE